VRYKQTGTLILAQIAGENTTTGEKRNKLVKIGKKV